MRGVPETALEHAHPLQAHAHARGHAHGHARARVRPLACVACGVQVPEKALGRLRALATTHRRYEQSYYNNPEKYRASTAAAVDAQRQALSRLAHPATWDDVSGDGAEKAKKMERAAQYCRRVGRGDVASALQRLAATLIANKGKFKAWRPGGNRADGPSLHALA